MEGSQHSMGYDWHGRTAIFNQTVASLVAGRSSIAGTHFVYGNYVPCRRFEGGRPDLHGRVGQLHPGTHSGTFSGFDHGGNVQAFSARGRSSLGGGFRGGDVHGGGGRHR
jgi:hypothetical protein